MNARRLVGAGIISGLVVIALLRAAPGAAPLQPPTDLAKAKVEAARKTYEVLWRNNKEGLVPFAELAYRWSRRWLEAELEFSDAKSNQLTAYQTHRDRMRELARITHERYRNRINTIDEVSATDFFTAEAEIWIEQAKRK